jgi:hypothetical protein
VIYTRARERRGGDGGPAPDTGKTTPGGAAAAG